MNRLFRWLKKDYPKNGKLCDVMFKDNYYSDHDFWVWADPGLYWPIRQIEGVTDVWQDDLHGPKYHVFLDARYSREYVKAEIVVAAIKCRGEA